MTSMLLELAVRHCDGKLVGVLEGGYNLEALEECVRTMVRRLVIGAGELDAIPSMGVGEAAIRRAVEIQRAMGNLPGQTG